MEMLENFKRANATKSGDIERFKRETFGETLSGNVIDEEIHFLLEGSVVSADLVCILDLGKVLLIHLGLCLSQVDRDVASIFTRRIWVLEDSSCS
jgi:hypothetical protein